MRLNIIGYSFSNLLNRSFYSQTTIQHGQKINPKHENEIFPFFFIEKDNNINHEDGEVSSLK